MLKMLRTRFTALVVMLVIAALVTACTSKPAAPAQAPAPAPAAQTPAPAPVDKGAILKEAVVNYFNNLPANQNLVEGADLKAKVEAKDPTIFLVDIRRNEDFVKGYTPGAINIPFAELGKQIDKLPKDKQIVLMCYSGQTSGQSIAALKLAGYNAVSLKGGYPTWEKSGGQIAK